LASEGIVIQNPLTRLSQEQVEITHRASLDILTDPGLISFNREASEIFADSGADVTPITPSDHPCWHVKIPEKMVVDTIASAPKTVKLGARNPDNTLILKGDEPKVHFITGSETNIWLDVEFPTFIRKDDPSVEIQMPQFKPGR